jgi:hypothetical protein
VRLAVLRFLFRTEISISVMRLPGMMEHEIPYAQAMKNTCDWLNVAVVDIDGIQGLVAEKKRFLASTDTEEKIIASATFHHYWHDLNQQS